MSHISRLLTVDFAGRSVDIRLGQKAYVWGPDESGKSTLLAALQVAAYYDVPDAGAKPGEPGKLLQYLPTGAKQMSATIYLSDGFTTTSTIRRDGKGANRVIACSPGPAGSKQTDVIPFVRQALGPRSISPDNAAWLSDDERRHRRAVLALIGQTAAVTAQQIVGKIREKMGSTEPLGFDWPQGDDPMDSLEKLAQAVDAARIEAERERKDASTKSREPLPEPPDAEHGARLEAALNAAVAALAGLRVSLGEQQERGRSQAAAEVERGRIAQAILRAEAEVQRLSGALAALPAAPVDVQPPSAEEIRTTEDALSDVEMRLDAATSALGAAQETNAKAESLAHERAHLAKVISEWENTLDGLRESLAALPAPPQDAPVPSEQKRQEAQTILQAAEADLAAAVERLNTLRSGLDATGQAQALRSTLEREIGSLATTLGIPVGALPDEVQPAKERVSDLYRQRDALGLQAQRDRYADLTTQIEATRKPIEERKAALAERQGALRALEGYAAALDSGVCPVLEEACDRIGAQKSRLDGERKAIGKLAQALSTLEVERTVLETERATLAREVRRLADEDTRIRGLIVAAEGALSEAERKRTAREQEAAQRVARLDGELTAKRAQLASLPAASDDSDAGLDAAERERWGAVEVRDAAKRAADALTVQTQAALTANASAAAERERLGAERRALVGRIERLDGRIAEMRATLAGLPAVNAVDCAGLEADVEALESQHATALFDAAELHDRARDAASHNRQAAEQRRGIEAQAAQLRQEMATLDGAQQERRSRLAALATDEAPDLAAAEAAVVEGETAEKAARATHQVYTDDLRRVQDAIDAHDHAVADVESWAVRRDQVKRLLAAIYEVQQEILQATKGPLIDRVRPYVPRKVERFDADLSGGGCKMGFWQGERFVPWQAIAESLRIAWLLVIDAARADLQGQTGARIAMLDGLYRVAPPRRAEVLAGFDRLVENGMADQIIVTGHDLPAGWDAEAAGWTVIELRPAAVEELAEEPEVEPEIAIVEAARAELAL